jgi:arylsulfatase
VPEAAAVDVRNRPHTIRAEIEVGGDTAPEGVLVAQGSYLGGWAFYVLDGCLRYVHNLSSRRIDQVTSTHRLGPGAHTVELRYGRDPAAPKLAQLVADGAVVGAAEIPQFSWNRFSLTGAGLTCGYALAPAVSDDFVAPFRFTATLAPVVVAVDGDPVIDADAEAEDAITSQ